MQQRGGWPVPLYLQLHQRKTITPVINQVYRLTVVSVSQSRHHLAYIKPKRLPVQSQCRSDSKTFNFIRMRGIYSLNVP